MIRGCVVDDRPSLSNNSRTGIVTHKAEFVRETIDREGQFWRPALPPGTAHSAGGSPGSGSIPLSRTWSQLKHSGASLVRLEQRQRELQSELGAVAAELQDLEGGSALGSARSSARSDASLGSLVSSSAPSRRGGGTTGGTLPGAAQYSSTPFRRAVNGGVLESSFSWGGAYVSSATRAAEGPPPSGGLHPPRPAGETRGKRQGSCSFTRAFNNPRPQLRLESATGGGGGHTMT
eukprot:g3405.t1